MTCLLVWVSRVAVLTLVSVAAAPTAAVASAPVAVPAPVAGERAGRRLVAVVKAPDADRTCQEIATRIIAELTADGVPVVALTCSTADPACLGGSGPGVAAVVLVRLRDNVRGVEVRAGDAIGTEAVPPAATGGSRGRVQHVSDVDAGGAPAALAVRTVELLRAMMFEVAEPPSAPVATVEQKADVEASPAQEQEEDEQEEPVAESAATTPFTMNIGAAMIGSLSGLDPAYGPAFSIGRPTSEHVLLSVFLAGPAFGRDQRNPGGTVAVRQEMAALQVDLVGAYRRVAARAGIGAGVYHIHIDGRPSQQSPQVGRSEGGFSGMLTWSAGVVANLRSDIGLFVDARVFVLTPTPVVLLNGLEVGRTGNPGIAVTTGVELRL